MYIYLLTDHWSVISIFATFENGYETHQPSTQRSPIVVVSPPQTPDIVEVSSREMSDKMHDTGAEAHPSKFAGSWPEFPVFPVRTTQTQSSDIHAHDPVV
jgi:hypothetical protein